MHKRYVIRQDQVDLLYAIVTRSTQLIPKLTVGDYSGIAKGLQNLPEFILEEHVEEQG